MTRLTPSNGLWQASRHKRKTINFPQDSGDKPSRCGDSPCSPVGATDIKPGWKVLSPSEIRSARFYATQGIVYNDEQGTLSPGTNAVTRVLVSLHILHKTAAQPNWLWSTFERVDNRTSSFFNPKCDSCPVNTELNAYYPRLLVGSVWEHFELISTQWTTGGAPAGTPPILANTTLETFIPPTSTCVGCHKKAQTVARRPPISVSCLEKRIRNGCSCARALSCQEAHLWRPSQTPT